MLSNIIEVDRHRQIGQHKYAMAQVQQSRNYRSCTELWRVAQIEAQAIQKNVQATEEAVWKKRIAVNDEIRQIVSGERRDSVRCRTPYGLVQVQKGHVALEQVHGQHLQLSPRTRSAI